MSLESNENTQATEQSIKHLCSLNFSIFTQKLKDLQGENRPKDKNGIIRKKWLRTIRSEMKADSLRTLIVYLCAAKLQIHRNQNLTRNFFKLWKDASNKKAQRASWQKMAYLAKIRQYQIRAVKLRECRVDLAANYILDQPQFKRPNFNLFASQLRPIEVDEPNPPESQAANERGVSLDESNQNKTPRSKRIIHVHTVEQATETIDPEESQISKLLKKVNIKKIMLLLFIGIGFALLTFYLYRFLYKKLGYYDRYQQHQFNQTLPPYNPSYDVDYVVNYTELLKSDHDQSIDSIVDQMSKEILTMKLRQTEMRDQIDELQNAYQEDL